jgi:solute carrier family 25 carnitine/acylcarnitine transporter 20/29
LEIVDDPESGKTFVSSAELVEKDIYASNGVLHTISTLLVPPGALKLTPEKYLLTLKCTTFVSMIHSVDLTHLINSTTEEYTILAPTDEVMKLFSGDGGGLPEKGSEELKRMLSYHFLPGKWAPEKLKDGMLVQTALEEEGLGGARQVLDVAVSGGDKEQSIRFGGASVLGEKGE